MDISKKIITYWRDYSNMINEIYYERNSEYASYYIYGKIGGNSFYVNDEEECE